MNNFKSIISHLWVFVLGFTLAATVADSSYWWSVVITLVAVIISQMVFESGSRVSKNKKVKY